MANFCVMCGRPIADCVCKKKKDSTAAEPKTKESNQARTFIDPIFGYNPVPAEMGTDETENEYEDTYEEELDNSIKSRIIKGVKSTFGVDGSEEEVSQTDENEYEDESKDEKDDGYKPSAKEISASTRYMSKNELWSWLKQTSKRQLFYTEKISPLTEDKYVEKVVNKLKQNHVPATLEKKNIRWDRSNYNRSNYYVKPSTDVINPLSCLFQFNHVGKFTFVEEKTFITPPDLPNVDKKKSLDQDATKAALIMIAVSAVALLVGLVMMVADESSGLTAFGLILMCVGLVLGYLSVKKIKTIKEIIEHNKKCDEQAVAWTNAWNNWENSIFVYSFQEDINGQLSRIYDAVFECVKQVNNEEFGDTETAEKEETTRMNELEEQIARRKDEYR